MKHLLLLTLFVILQVSFLTAQVAINYDGSQPTSHTLLDLKSDTTGLLIPRMSHTQMGVLGDKLDNAHKGMVIYNNNAKMLFFWDGSEFIYMQSGIISKIHDDDYDTYIDTEFGTDPDEIEIATGGTIYWTYKDGRINVTNTGNSIFLGSNAGEDDDLSDNNNVLIGENAGSNNTTGSSNVGIGSYALFSNGVNPYYAYYSADNIAIGNNSLRSNTTGYKNTSVGSESMYSTINGQRNSAFGYKALYANTTGYDNVAVGHEAMVANLSGYYNIVLGSDALKSQTSGYRNIALGKSAMYNSNNSNFNVAIGAASMYSSTSGNGNIMMGYQAGYGNFTGEMNIMIGYQAGYSETGSNKLYIDNTNTISPLIYGDFSSDILSFFGEIGINTKDPLGAFHVNSNTKSNNTIYITPATTSSGDSSSIFLAENHNATYGMYWMYDGDDNQMELWGKSLAINYGPHLTIDRNDGDMKIDGNLALGGEFADDYKLSVAGKVICEELRINLQADWPDYVFKNDYKLIPIKQLETFIQNNGHLPNVPTTSEIESSGLEVGETQRLMMEKIEELTLYIIEQNKITNDQQKQINELKGTIEKLLDNEE